MAVRDYIYGVRYAFTRPWRATRDVGLHKNVVASLFGLICGALVPISVAVDGEPRNLLWCVPFLVLGLANAGYVVYRYRHRNEPERMETWIATKMNVADSSDDQTDLSR